MDGSLFFLSRGSWDDFRSGWGDTGAMINAGLIVIASMPHAPQNEGTGMNQKGADNGYATEQRAFGAWLASQGWNKPNLIIRLDWEFNGDWYNWSAKYGGAAVFKRAYQNFVTNVRAGGATKVRFNMCANKGPSQTGIDYSAFPGAEYCDVFGVDQYDQWAPAFNDSQWTNQINGAGVRLKNLRDFAVAQGIMWSLDEGGNTHDGPGDPAGSHGGDNPFYWTKIWQFFNDPDNYPSCAWHNTYNHVGAPVTLKHNFANNPSSFNVYKTTFGGY